MKGLVTYILSAPEAQNQEKLLINDVEVDLSIIYKNCTFFLVVVTHE